MDGLTLITPIGAHLTWNYEPGTPQLLDLYERGKRGQWNASTDVDWSVPVEFGELLRDQSDYAVASFNDSPLARYGQDAWNTFRWEFQSWMVSQFLHGEQGALLSAARLVEVVPGIDAKYFAASQVADEARHVEAFSRYLRENVPEKYPVCSGLASLLTDSLSDSRWDITALSMQIIVETLAMAAFRLADKTFHDDLIRQICRLVARDEARHVSFGILSLHDAYLELSAAELAEREEFVLEAAHQTSRRFLLEEIWERMGVPRDEGLEFARSSQLMIRYRQTIFASTVAALRRIGLMTDRVRAGFEALDLLGFAGKRLTDSTL